MRTSLRIGLAVALALSLAIAIPTTWMPTLLGVTVTDSGVDIRYNASAVDGITGTVASGPTESGGESASRTETATRSDAERAEALIHERINEIRQENDRRPLSRSDELNEVAQYHSDDMAENGYFDHTSPAGESMQSRYQQFGIGCAGGENIYRAEATYGVGVDDAAEGAVDSWMTSPGHRENILRQRFSQEGIGVTFVGGEVFVTQNFC